ncbi:MAG: hypothetical protein R2851_13520 [Caldilineaceae bacterium]
MDTYSLFNDDKAAGGAVVAIITTPGPIDHAAAAHSVSLIVRNVAGPQNWRRFVMWEERFVRYRSWCVDKVIVATCHCDGDRLSPPLSNHFAAHPSCKWDSVGRAESRFFFPGHGEIGMPRAGAVRLTLRRVWGSIGGMTIIPRSAAGSTGRQDTIEDMP